MRYSAQARHCGLVAFLAAKSASAACSSRRPTAWPVLQRGEIRRYGFAIPPTPQQRKLKPLRRDGGVRFKQERVMKSRLINTVSAINRRLPRHFPRISRAGLALTGAVCVLTLSGCYYPYGYYPGGYYPYYSTVPAGATQQDLQVGPPDSQVSPQAQQQQQQQQGPQTQQQYSARQAQNAQQSPPATYPVAVPPPVYVAPAYPAYYPPAYPAYPAYYGYPGWYGPSVSIGFGFGGYWGGGGHGGWGHGGGHGH
jgi:hypothetical protein